MPAVGIFIMLFSFPFQKKRNSPNKLRQESGVNLFKYKSLFFTIMKITKIYIKPKLNKKQTIT